MYTKFDIIDQSAITPIPVQEPVYKPLYLIGSTFDKGPEEFTMNEGSTYFKRYGEVSFERHGQPNLQAARIINAGGRCFVKRVVAPDAALANVGVFATLKKTTTGTGTAESPTKTTLTVSYSTKTLAQGAKDADQNLIINTVDSISDHMYGEGTFTEPTTDISTVGITYPLFVICDNGRGVSKKRFRVGTDYATAKAREWMMYTFEVMESNEALERISFGLYPDATYVNDNISLKTQVNKNSMQLVCRSYDDSIRAMIAKVAEVLALDADDLKSADILFGRTRKGIVIPNLIVDGVKLGSEYGIPLESGDNGEFKTNPTACPKYSTEMAKVFDGTFDDVIYDLDNYKFDVIFDANYDAVVKRAIEGLVTFREDCFFFRDLGTGLKSMVEIINADATSLKNRYCASYHNSYDVKDPYSKKQITVTAMYDLAPMLVGHFGRGRNLPFCGMLYEITFPNAIEGTVNFVPKIIPSVNQKDELKDARINFASYYDGVLVLETEYTSQEPYTQFSFLNNVLTTQELVKAIRSHCPRTRYQFLDGDDFKNYKEDVERVIAKYAPNFRGVKFEYLGDSTMEANKIFYAAISVVFRDFIQSEWFRLTALPSGTNLS